MKKSRDKLRQLGERAAYYHWSLEPDGKGKYFVTSPYTGEVVPWAMTIAELEEYFDDLDETDRH